MKIRNLFALITLSVTALIMTGCLDDGSLSTVEYNNAVVEMLNDTSAAIEDTTTVYDDSIPNIVTEETEVETTEMQISYEAAKLQLETAYTVLDIISKNSTQQEEVRAEFQAYLDLGSDYIETFETVLSYYGGSEFAENLDLVAEYDEGLHTGYNDFINSNNNLVDILADFIE
jgi:hypothetical protein